MDILKIIELIALTILVYILLETSGNIELITLIMVFGVLSVTGVVWFAYSNKLNINIPNELKKALTKSVIIGSIVTLILTILILIIFGGGL